MSTFYALSSLYTAAAAMSEASDASKESRAKRTDARQLADQLERTLLACEGMWTLVRDKLGLTDEDLVARINEIDLSDGRLDGKVRKTAVACPKCNRTISPRLPKCMYCGQPIVHDPFA
jgi:hypothetical protein